MINTRLHVGNLPATSTQQEVQDLFATHGNVVEVNLPVERESRRPRGFAIVTMATSQGAQAALLALHGHEVEGCVLTVTEHVPAKTAPPVTGQKGKSPSGSEVRQEVSAFRRLFGVF